MSKLALHFCTSMEIQLSALKRLIQNGEEFGDHWLVDGSEFGLTRALLKMDGFGANEFIGYRMAGTIAVPVPEFSGIWLESSGNIGEAKFERGTFGMLIEYYDNWRNVGWPEAVRNDPAAVGRSLALCIFDRHEWGEFGITNGHMKFVDLERLFPAIFLEYLGQANSTCKRDAVGTSLRTYLGGIPLEIEAVVQEAEKLGVMESFTSAIGALTALEDAKWDAIFDLSPHPAADDWKTELSLGARMRLRYATRALSIRTAKT